MPDTRNTYTGLVVEQWYVDAFYDAVEELPNPTSDAFGEAVAELERKTGEAFTDAMEGFRLACQKFGVTVVVQKR